MGDRFLYGLGFTYRPELETGQSAWDFILEMNGEYVGRLKEGGIVDEFDGGHVIYISPGVRFSSQNAWAAYVSVGIPVLTDMNGSEPDPHFRVLAGLSKAF